MPATTTEKPRIDQLQERLDEASHAHRRARRRWQEARQEVEDLEGRLARAESQAAESKDVDAALDQAEEVREELDRARRRARAFRKKMKAKSDEADRLRDDLTSARSRASRLDSDIRRKRNKLKYTREEISDIESRLETFRQKEDRLERELDGLLEELHELAGDREESA